MSDEIKMPPGSPPWAQHLFEQQKRTATSVGNLTLALSSQDKRLQSQHDHLNGVLLAALSRPKKGKRGEDDEDTDKFPLPGRSGTIELTRRTQRRIIQGVLYAAAFVVSHIVAYVLTHGGGSLAPHRDHGQYEQQHNERGHHEAPETP